MGAQVDSLLAGHQSGDWEEDVTSLPPPGAAEKKIRERSSEKADARVSWSVEATCWRRACRAE